MATAECLMGNTDPADDFPKPVKRDHSEPGSGQFNNRKASHALVDWVKRYFVRSIALTQNQS